MTTRRGEVRRIFDLACDLEPSAREECLRQHCGGDVELRRQVEELLHLDREPRLLRDDRLGGLWQNLNEDASTLPERIGPFRVLGVLGRGGMGVVYRARQEQPARDVAIKVLAPGFGDVSSRARFALEAEALGRLQHPGIAQIYAVGNFDVHSGEPPYLAMELVEGEPLDRWAGNARPDLPARLGVLLQIADAVHHAHQRGLIHRDLKPGNVFVDHQGRAKVLDFGIARLIDEDRERTLLTRTGQLLGTPAYMSPEQASGQPDRVDVRTDVYAVGAVGYELLTGSPPLDVARDSLPTALRRVVEDEPLPLGHHDRQLAGDLQTIFATALRKEPEHRYPSMSAFADDLRRYLAHEPIQARPATARYIAARFVRRHRGLVAGTGLALIALLLGAGAAVWWAVRAERAAERAARAETTAADEARVANRVTSFVEGLFSAAAPDVAKGRTITAKDLVEKGAADIRGELADDPLLRARLSRFLGTVLSEMGDPNAALPLIEDALTTLRELRQPDDPSVLRTLVDKARTLFIARDSAAARPLFAEALALHEAAGLPHDLTFIRCHEGLGSCALELRDLDAATEHFTIVRDARPQDTDPAVRASDFVRLANVANLRGDHDAADQGFTAALVLLRQVDDPMMEAHVATNLGVLRMAQNRPQDAEPLFREALAAGERLLGPDHPLLIRRLGNLAAVLSTEGRPEEAEPLLERALALGEKQGAKADDGVANVTMNLGNVRLAQGRVDEALELYRRSATIYERIGGPDSADLADALENQAMALDRLGEAHAAAELRRRVAEIRGR